jgi:hypothetical protein
MTTIQCESGKSSNSLNYIGKYLSWTTYILPMLIMLFLLFMLIWRVLTLDSCTLDVGLGQILLHNRKSLHGQICFIWSICVWLNYVEAMLICTGTYTFQIAMLICTHLKYADQVII